MLVLVGGLSPRHISQRSTAPDAHQGHHYIWTGPSTSTPTGDTLRGGGWLRCSDAPGGHQACGLRFIDDLIFNQALSNFIF